MSVPLITQFMDQDGNWTDHYVIHRGKQTVALTSKEMREIAEYWARKRVEIMLKEDADRRKQFGLTVREPR